MRVLTKAEEQVMKVVWQLGNGLLMEIVNQMHATKPHKNTIATILKTLVEKGFIHIESLGRVYRYHPAISKDEYSKATLTNVAKGYFKGSFTDVVSFLIDNRKLSVDDLESLLKQLKSKKNL